MSNTSLQRVQALDGRVSVRVILGGVTAWLFPSWALPLGAVVASVIASPSREMAGIGLEYLVRGLILIPLIFLVVGAPTLIVGFLGWFLLHRAGHRGPGAALLLGLFAPFGSIGAVSLFGADAFSGEGGAIFLGCLVLLGGLTGLLVRWVAYPAAARAAQTVDRTARLTEDAAS